MSRFQKGKTNLDFTAARDSEWQWHQLGHMQVYTSLQTDNHASTSPLSFIYHHHHHHHHLIYHARTEHKILKLNSVKYKYGRLPEKLQLIELAAYANQTKLFNTNCNNYNNNDNTDQMPVLPPNQQRQSTEGTYKIQYSRESSLNNWHGPTAETEFYKNRHNEILPT